MGIGFYPKAEIVVNGGKGGGKGGRGKGGRGRGGYGKGGRGRRGAAEDDDDAYADDGTDEEEESTPRRYFVKLLDAREPSSASSLDDLWLLSARVETLHVPIFARALWHGPASNGMLEITVVQSSPSLPLRSGAKCVALRGPNASDMLAQLEMLTKLQLQPSPSPPILRYLLAPRSTPSAPLLALCHKGGTTTHLAPLLETALERFRLNEEQARVLRRVAAWVDSPEESTTPPTLLVHGVFGAGKSHLLVSVLWYLQRALLGVTRQGRPVKVLLAALTNVAVDNVLEGLIACAGEGEDPGVLRVGALRRIAPAVLPHSTHGKLAIDDEAATKRELQRELQSSTSGHERESLQQAIAQIDSGRMRARAQAIGKYRVVGATCAATGLPCLAGVPFDIVLLDECSQLTEPASMLPLMRVQCSRLLAVGDPMQLPPTLHNRTTPGASPSANGSSNATDGASGFDLTLTLFQRLARCGVDPVLLRQQYRCHPSISGLASRLFYASSLTDGLGDAAHSARAPLLDGLPTIGFAEVRGAERVDRSGSISNLAEANRVVRLVQSLHSAGLAPTQLGVICLYSAQASLCRRLLAETSTLAESGVTVSTVDAFQGAERDVIIVSSCRSARDGQLRFIAHEQRLNVTLTRARHHLLIFGSANVLCTEGAWAEVLGAAKPIPALFFDAVESGAAEGPPQLPMEATEAEAEAGAAALGSADAHDAGGEEEMECPHAPWDEDFEDNVCGEMSEAAEAAAGVVDNVAADGMSRPEHANPVDELEQLLAARRRRAVEDEEMKAQVHAEMAARMDTGVRVNPALKRALLGDSAAGGTTGAHDQVDLLALADDDSDEGEEGGAGGTEVEAQDALALLDW